MSGCAVLVHRDGSRLVPGEFDALVDALDHSGPDGRDVLWRRSAALAHLHFWTTPEEVGEKQPLSDAEAGVDLVFNGRLDNRDELADMLGVDRPDRDLLSDAALVLRAFTSWGDHCFEHFLGPFAIVALDSRSGRVVCARDALGDRTLYYHAGPALLVVASEESALLRHPAISPSLDETSMARFFAVEAPVLGATFFSAIRELLPGHAMAVDCKGLRTWRHWRPEELPRIHHRSDQIWIEHFRQTLADSVHCRMRTLQPPAVLMSGGLDSTSVAALAAQALRSAQSGDRLCTISWVFDELHEADEREFIEPMIERFDLDARLLVGDDGWPLSDLPTWPVSPNAPFQGLYRRLTDRAYAEARESGARTLLSGHFGDHVYSAKSFWMRDLLAGGRLFEAWRSLVAELHGHGFRSAKTRARVRRVIARALGRRPRTAEVAPWLTPRARDLVAANSNPGTVSLPARYRERARGFVDPTAAQAASREKTYAAGFGIDLRRPYRDRRLMELMASMPAHLLYRRGWTKWVLRAAMHDLLPDSVRLRTRRSTLQPLAKRGCVEREHDTVLELLQHPDADWRQYVDAGWLESRLPDVFEIDGVEAVVAWHSAIMELWKRNLELAQPHRRGNRWYDQTATRCTG